MLSAQPHGGTPVHVHLSIIQTVEFRTLLLLPLYSTDNTVFIPGGILTEVTLMKNSINAKDVSKVRVEGRLFIQPSFRKFWLERKLNRPFWFSLARIFDNTFQLVVHFGLSYWYD